MPRHYERREALRRGDSLGRPSIRRRMLKRERGMPRPYEDQMRCTVEPSIAPEYNRREPAGGERHGRGGEPVEHTVIARRGGHHLLEPGFVDFKRGGRAGKLCALGKETALHLVGSAQTFRPGR